MRNKNVPPNIYIHALSPFEEGREYYFPAVRLCLSVCLLVCRSFGPPMIYVHFLHRGCMYGDKI